MQKLDDTKIAKKLYEKWTLFVKHEMQCLKTSIENTDKENFNAIKNLQSEFEEVKILKTNNRKLQEENLTLNQNNRKLQEENDTLNQHHKRLLTDNDTLNENNKRLLQEAT